MIQFDNNNLADLKSKLDLINEYGMSSASRTYFYYLKDLLNPNLEKENGILFRQFKSLQYKFGFLGLSNLREKDIFSLIENHLGVIFEIEDYDLWEKIRNYLIIFADYRERDRIKDTIKNLLIQNKAKITKKNLILSNETVSGTLENWVKDYHGFLGTGVVDNIKFEEYFINSKNIKALENIEREKVKNLLKLYEKLKISSNSPNGFEESITMEIDGKIMNWNDGKLEDVDPEAKKAVDELEKLGFFKQKNENKTIGANVIKNDNAEKINNLKLMLKNYSPSSLEYKAIEEEIKRLEARR